MNERRVEGAVRNGSSKMQQSVSSLTGVAQSRARRAAKQRFGELHPMNGRLAGGWLKMTTAGAIQLLSANSSRSAAMQKEIRMKYSGPSA
jgi:hypothetical protein